MNQELNDWQDEVDDLFLWIEQNIESNKDKAVGCAVQLSLLATKFLNRITELQVSNKIILEYYADLYNSSDTKIISLKKDIRWMKVQREIEADKLNTLNRMNNVIGYGNCFMDNYEADRKECVDCENKKSCDMMKEKAELKEKEDGS